MIAYKMIKLGKDEKGVRKDQKDKNSVWDFVNKTLNGKTEI